jgi:hypothetical protein
LSAKPAEQRTIAERRRLEELGEMDIDNNLTDATGLVKRGYQFLDISLLEVNKPVAEDAQAAFFSINKLTLRAELEPIKSKWWYASEEHNEQWMSAASVIGPSACYNALETSISPYRSMTYRFFATNLEQASNTEGSS